ncbi:MAG TPA: hypothetical protein VMT52_16080 [Planctomycetota bacterium]|nr:hypothetical protein [Planctomycetota bacterium]
MRTAEGADLLVRARGLCEALEALRSLNMRAGDDPRLGAILLLQSKVIPELEADLDLPVFVGVQGGTNTGKSTVFNALCGKILSPSLVVASATKHPLVSVHERWRAAFLEKKPFPNLECRELSDPRELIVDGDRTELVYLRFHDDARAEAVALIDSPDFDGALQTNAETAARIAAISDLTIFVTTVQKYKDKLLLDELRRLLVMKGKVLCIFNLIEEPIVFETVLDDLRSALEVELAGDRERLEALRIPPSRAKHPEDDVRQALELPVLDRITAFEPRALKVRTLQKTLERVLQLAGETVARLSGEASFKREMKKLAESAADDSARDYAASFHLALPEETLAIQKILRLTELWPRLELRPEIERTSKALAFVGSALRRSSDTIRRVLVRLSRSDEGTLEPGAAALEEYARARNQTDTEAVVRHAESMRVRLESLVRGREVVSPLAQEILKTHFTPDRVTGLARDVRRIHGEATAKTRGTGEDVLERVERWIESNPRKALVLGLGGILFKVSAGLLAAWALPSSGSIFAIFDPLRWISFAAGYLLAAYILALLVSVRSRSRRKFQASREEAMRTTIRKAFIDPVFRAMDEVLRDKDLKRITSLSREIAAKLPALEAERPVPAKPR